MELVPRAALIAGLRMITKLRADGSAENAAMDTQVQATRCSVLVPKAAGIPGILPEVFRFQPPLEYDLPGTTIHGGKHEILHEEALKW